MPALAEMLIAAAGRIVLNLDIKDLVHAETPAPVVAAQAQRRVLVKATAEPVAGLAQFASVPFMPMYPATTTCRW